VPEEKRPSESLSLGGSIILKLFLKTYDGRWSTELIRLSLKKKDRILCKKEKAVCFSGIPELFRIAEALPASKELLCSV
jgi:hypothetical protein